MYFVLDIICVLIIVGMVIRFWSSALSSVILRGLCVLLGIVIAVFVTAPLAQMGNAVLVQPVVERSAANELADMVSGTHRATGRETAQRLDLTRLIQDQPPAFVEWVERYHADPATAVAAYNKQHSGEALLTAVTGDYCMALSKSGSFAVLWVISVLLLLWIARRIELNMAPPARRTTGAKIGAPLLGAVVGILIVMGLTVFLEWLVPYLSGRTMMFPANMLTAGTVYPILKFINPFLWFV
ncbi:MAG: hypothetical protein IKI63_04940 [Clostridia bacterium]|nr:hypothetical protein [Clostridia bacterium]